MFFFLLGLHASLAFMSLGSSIVYAFGQYLGPLIVFSCWASPLYYCWLALSHGWCPFIMAIGLYPGEVVRHGQQVPAHFLVLLRPYRPVVYTYLMSAWVMPWAGYLSQVWRNFLRGWLVIVCLAN